MKRLIAVTVFVTFFVSNSAFALSAELFAEEVTELQTTRGLDLEQRSRNRFTDERVSVR